MIAMKNAANGATYMTAARIVRMAARTRWLATDKAMAERARTGQSTPSHNAESTSNQRASVGSASLPRQQKPVRKFPDRKTCNDDDDNAKNAERAS